MSHHCSLHNVFVVSMRRLFLTPMYCSLSTLSLQTSVIWNFSGWLLRMLMPQKLCPVALFSAQIKPREAREEPSSSSHAHLRKAGNVILQQVRLGSQSGKRRPGTPKCFPFPSLTAVNKELVTKRWRLLMSRTENLTVFVYMLLKWDAACSSVFSSIYIYVWILLSPYDYS